MPPRRDGDRDSPDPTGSLTAAAPRDVARALDHVRRFGAHAVAFQSLESGMRHWFDAAPPAGTGALVAYAPAGSAWVAAGTPIGPPEHVARAAQRFAESAGAAGQRACFFAAETIPRGFKAIPIGEQPVLEPASWLDEPGRRRIREQLRRAHRKGVSTRRVEPDAIRVGTALRAELDALSSAWLRARRMEPMGFLVSLEPFHAPEEHRYIVAERGGCVVGFLSAVPIPAERGWLVEDLLRTRGAPNGTAESLLAALCREVAGAASVTLGLAPLAGRRPWWARSLAVLGRPLYDFDGLRAFKTRLHPARWQPVYLVHRQRTSFWPVLDSLRAFAGGSLLRFGARSLVAHPVGPPWALSMVLGIWTVVLTVLAIADRAEIFGYARATLAAWVVFDAFLAALLFRFALRPRAAWLAVATALAATDAALSLLHLARSGLPVASWHLALRFVATVGPVGGALALGWAAVLRIALERRRPGGR